MKKNKGFTLIELLAIIVILAIIAVITVPIILNVIDNAKKGTAKDSAYGYKDAISKYYVSGMLEDESIKLSGDYNVVDGKLGEYDIPFSGTKPTSGYLTFENNALTSGCLTIDEYKVSFDKGEVTDVEVGECGSKVAYKCKRATELHTEECKTDNCSDIGYTSDVNGTLISFGNLKSDDKLRSGDAFDCDVNGDGTYDSQTERFYYVSDLYNTTTKQFDSNYAVLIYYNNTVNGESDNTDKSSTEYDSVSERCDGPVKAIKNLPTVEKWNNVSLSTTTRAILNEKSEDVAGDCSYNLPSSFDYSIEENGKNIKLSSRLLTVQEAAVACQFNISEASMAGSALVDINNCLYLTENTKFIDYKYGAVSLMLENVFSISSRSTWHFYSYNNPGFNVNYGITVVRPVIEVLKTDIEI